MQNYRWAIVTGASAGIGAAFAKRLAAAGWSLILTARRLERLRELQTQLPVETRIVSADLGTEAGRDELWHEVGQVPAETVDLLVNNAGFGEHGLCVAQDRCNLLDMIDVNVKAVTDLALRYLALRSGYGKGAIVNVGSVTGFRTAPQMAVYSATKSFVLSFSEALAVEVAESGMRVLALCPGPVPTEFQSRAGSRIRGLKEFVAVSADQVASEGLAALEKGKRVCVPGRRMRILLKAYERLPAMLLQRSI